jgi:hypothetical protein
MAHQRLKVGEVIVLIILLGEVDVRIDEARQQRRIAEVDHLRVGGYVDICASSDDAVALHDHDTIANDSVRGAVEEPRGAEHDRFRRRGRLSEHLRCGEKKNGCDRFHVGGK